VAVAALRRGADFWSADAAATAFVDDLIRRGKVELPQRHGRRQEAPSPARSLPRIPRPSPL